MNRRKTTLTPSVDGLERREVLSAMHSQSMHFAHARFMDQGSPIQAQTGIGAFLGGLGIPFQPGAPQFVSGPFFGGTPGQFFGSGGLGPGPMFMTGPSVAPGFGGNVPTASFGGNVPGSSFGLGSGGRGMTSPFRFNPIRDFALGGQTVVVGLQGPGIGNFTSDLSIQFRQHSAQAIRPFNAVPGAETTFGFAIGSDGIVFGF
jgi:hypothetical protein